MKLVKQEFRKQKGYRLKGHYCYRNLNRSCGSWCALFRVEDERAGWEPTGRKIVVLCNGRREVCEVEK